MHLQAVWESVFIVDINLPVWISCCWTVLKWMISTRALWWVLHISWPIVNLERLSEICQLQITTFRQSVEFSIDVESRDPWKTSAAPSFWTCSRGRWGPERGVSEQAKDLMENSSMKSTSTGEVHNDIVMLPLLSSKWGPLQLRRTRFPHLFPFLQRSWSPTSNHRRLIARWRRAISTCLYLTMLTNTSAAPSVSH